MLANRHRGGTGFHVGNQFDRRPGVTGNPFYDATAPGLGKTATFTDALGITGLPLSRQGGIGLGGGNNPLSMLDESFRKRSSWNDRFEHWQDRASDTEEATLDRAARAVRSAIAINTWLSGKGVVVEPQGSYHNNTNTRQEADVDLRAVHPALKIDFDPNVNVGAANTILGYSDYGATYGEIFGRLRSNLISSLRYAGHKVDDSGKKALRVEGVTGSRGEADVVPAVRLHRVRWLQRLGRYELTEGIAIFSTDSQWTFNFPAQHTANGIAKRARTKQRFKKVVRIFKRLRADMIDRGLLKSTIPSYFVECIVYAVEDDYFVVETDDHYGRVKRIAHRMRELLANRFVATGSLTEINGIKPLFGPGQAWTYEQAKTFVDAVLVHLGDA
jgi:hypothetical protein